MASLFRHLRLFYFVFTLVLAVAGQLDQPGMQLAGKSQYQAGFY